MITSFGSRRIAKSLKVSAVSIEEKIGAEMSTTRVECIRTIRAVGDMTAMRNQRELRLPAGMSVSAGQLLSSDGPIPNDLSSIGRSKAHYSTSSKSALEDNSLKACSALDRQAALQAIGQ